MTLQTDIEKLQQQQEETNAAHEFYQFFREPANQQYNLICNERLIREYLNGDQITQQTLEEAVERLGGRLARKSLEQVAQTQDEELKQEVLNAVLSRDQLERDILAQIANPGSRNFERSKLKYKTDQQLQERLVQLKESRRLRSLSVEQLHQEVRNGQKQVVAENQARLPESVKMPTSKKELWALSNQDLRQLLYTKSGQIRPGVKEQLDALARS